MKKEEQKNNALRNVTNQAWTGKETSLILVVDVLAPSRPPRFFSVAFDDVPMARNDGIKVPLGDSLGIGCIGLDIFGQ